MIKAKTTNGDLIFGLSKENVTRLQNGQPIYALREEMNKEIDLGAKWICRLCKRPYDSVDERYSCQECRDKDSADIINPITQI